MSEIQIQNLPTALTPLGANDVLPVVQSGITRSVSISSGAFAMTDRSNVFTSANTFSANQRIDANLGIGTISGSYKLQTLQTGGSSISANFRTDQAASYISFRDTTNASDTSICVGSTGNNLVLITNSVERLSVDNSGNVGIGRTPVYKLDVAINSGGAARFATNSGTSANDAGVLMFTTASATPATREAGVYIDGNGGDGTGADYAFFLHRGDNRAILGNQGSGTLEFQTSGAERMRIDSGGNVLVGYTTSNGAYKLQVNSQIFATSATIATSDRNYKEDITPLDGALDIVSALNPVQFSWKEHPVHNFDRAQPTVGFLAQEVQQVLAGKPYLNSIVKTNICTIEHEEVDGEGNVTKPAVTEEFLGIAEGNMIALLTKAIQELKADFDTYKASHP